MESGILLPQPTQGILHDFAVAVCLHHKESIVDSMTAAVEQGNGMPLKSVIFTSRRDVESRPGLKDWAVISISEPFNYPARLNDGWHSILRLEFHDIENENWPQTIFSKQHACDIIAFAQQAAGACEGILVHCKAGISRSSAVAKWIAEKYHLPFDFEYGLCNHRVYSTLKEVENTCQNTGAG